MPLKNAKNLTNSKLSIFILAIINLCNKNSGVCKQVKILFEIPFQINESDTKSNELIKLPFIFNEENF